MIKSEGYAGSSERDATVEEPSARPEEGCERKTGRGGEMSGGAGWRGVMLLRRGKNKGEVSIIR